MVPTQLSVFAFLFVQSGEPSADARWGKCELPYGGPEQRAGALRPVSPWAPGNCLPAAWVRGQCRCGVWKWHESPLLRSCCRTLGTSHAALQVGGQGEEHKDELQISNVWSHKQSLGLRHVYLHRLWSATLMLHITYDSFNPGVGHISFVSAQ